MLSGGNSLPCALLQTSNATPVTLYIQSNWQFNVRQFNVSCAGILIFAVCLSLDRKAVPMLRFRNVCPRSTAV